MRVTLIHNSMAGGDEYPSIDEVLALIRAEGHTVVHEPLDGDHWMRALDNPGDLVAVAGGDGTVGAVAGRLIRRHVPIAVLPMGTANNIAKTLGLSEIPLERLIAAWADARLIGFDAGVVSGPWGTTHFVEGVGIGLLAHAISQPDFRELFGLARPDDRESRIETGLRWLQKRLDDWPVKALTMTLDGKDLSGEYILLEVMNTQHIGPNLQFAPDADPSDGLLDVVLFSADQRKELNNYIANRMQGHHDPLQRTVPKAKHLQLRWDGSDMHFDDKAWLDAGTTRGVANGRGRSGG